MSFHLAAQKAEATTPLPESTEDCALPPTGNLTPERKGLIAVGAVLGVLLIILALLAIYKWCIKKPAAPSKVHESPSPQPGTPHEPEDAAQHEQLELQPPPSPDLVSDAAPTIGPNTIESGGRGIGMDEPDPLDKDPPVSPRRQVFKQSVH